MSALPCDWYIVGEVTAEQSSRTCFAPDGGIWRIRTIDRQLRAPGYPTFGVAGLLITRPTVAPILPASGVRVEPLSGAR